MFPHMNATKASGNATSSSARWWENYLVRYFVGTVVGAGIVLFLAEQSSGVLQSLSGKFFCFLKEGSTRAFIVAGAAGLTYCYVASSPMMILHASRAQLFNLDKKRPFSWPFYTILAAIILVLGFAGFRSLLFPNMGVAWLLPTVVFLGIFAPQVSLIFLAHWAGFDSIRRFYLSLGEARSAASGDDRSESAETYRHLREHSNAYAIIILELLFGVVLAHVPDGRWLVAIIVMWVLPAAYCWFVASLLEMTFVRHYTTMVAPQAGEATPHGQLGATDPTLPPVT
jgi:hypothetical protein